MINVRTFGAKGDGGTDDTLAIRAALNSAMQSNDRRVLFPTGTYQVTGQLIVPSGVHIEGDGIDATVVTAKDADPAKFPDRGVFVFRGGGKAALPNLAQDVRRYDATIQLQPGASLKPDDVLVILDSRPGSYCAVRPTYTAGEFLHVAEVSGQQLRLVGGLQASYRKGDVSLYKMVTPTSSSIRGMTVLGTGKIEQVVSCLRFEFGRGVTVRDVRLAGCQYALCVLYHCYGANIDNVEAAQLIPGSGLQYGIVVANCQDVRIVNSRVTAQRHAVTIGGEEGPVDRQITVMNCDLKSFGIYQALDAHGHAEGYTFQNNRVHGGIVFGGARGRIIGNDIYGAARDQASEAIRASEWKGTGFEIRDNTIRTTAVSGYSGKEGALYFYIASHTTEADGATIISGNKIHVDGGAGDRRGIFLLNDGSPARWNVLIENNYFEAETDGYCFAPSPSHGNIHTVIMRNNIMVRCKATPGPQGKIQTWIYDNLSNNILT